MAIRNLVFLFYYFSWEIYFSLQPWVLGYWGKKKHHYFSEGFEWFFVGYFTILLNIAVLLCPVASALSSKRSGSDIFLLLSNCMYAFAKWFCVSKIQTDQSYKQDKTPTEHMGGKNKDYFCLSS